MRLLEIGKFYPPYRGGMETLLGSMSEGFVRAGTSVECVVANTRNLTETASINGVRVHRAASFGTLFSTSLSPAYLRLCRTLPADLWHAHFPNPLADLSLPSRPRGVPAVLTYHSDVVRQRWMLWAYRWILLRALGSVDRIAVATPRQIDCSPWLTRFRAKCVVIPFGIALARFLDPSPAVARRAAELRASARGRPVILNVGRFVPYKGQTHLIQALRSLDAECWFVGSGPLSRALQDQVAALGLGDRVRFAGEVTDEDLPAWYHACDLFVLPSVTPNEAFGLVQVEAMACGKPVVCCDLASGVPFVNRHGETGLVVPPGDPPALAAALARLLGSAELRRQFGAAGRARALAEFDEPVMIRRYMDLFRSLLPPGE